MGFFARPNLEDVAFKQINGSTLTLSGQTRIASIGGLSFLSGTTYIPIIITGGTNYDVLTLVNGQLKLEVPSSGASTGYYTCRTPSTVCVGGLSTSTILTGRTIANILQEVLAPVCNPTIALPSVSSFTIIPNTLYYEIGCTASITACMCFSRGSVVPQYCGSSQYRSGLPNTYKYQNFDGTYCCCAISAPSNSFAMSRTILLGKNNTCGSVCYDIGTLAYNSTGGTTFVTPNPLPAGVTSVLSATTCGILPWYWGLSTGCTINNICIASRGRGSLGCKCVGLATGTLSIIYNSLSNDYLWFAVPNGTAAKTCWCVNGGDNSCIGWIGNLFATSCTVAVTSAEGCWTGCNYMVYVSCYPTGTAAGVPMYIS